MSPQGLSGPFNKIYSNPDNLKKEIRDAWDKDIAGKIETKKSIKLESDLEKFIDAVDYKKFKIISPDKLISDVHRRENRHVYFQYFGVRKDDIERIKIDTPAEHQDYEAKYIHHLMDAYNDVESVSDVTPENVEETGENGSKKTTTYYNIKFTHDTKAYRLTRFRAEAPKYMEIESATFYYIFTLFFLMIDSRAKNMFMGFHGSPTTGLQYLKRKVVFEPYDMDTALGTNNSGVLKFGYYHLDTDTVSNIISGDDNSGKYRFTYVYAQGEGIEPEFIIDPKIFTDLQDTESYPNGISVDSSDEFYSFNFKNDGTC